MLIESSQIILQELSANWPALAEFAKLTPAILLLETVVAHIKWNIVANMSPYNSQRIVDTKTGTDFTVEPGEKTSVTWHCPVHQAKHTLGINHVSLDHAEIISAGSVDTLSPVSGPINIVPEVSLEWVE